MTNDKKPFLALFLLLFALYLITWSPDPHSSDGLAMFSTAESLVRRGAWDSEQIRWMGLQQGTFGLDGKLYSRKGLGQPLLALPLTRLGLAIPGFGTLTVTMLFGSLITALTGVLIAGYLRRLGYKNSIAMLAGLAYGTGTMALPYAKTFFSDTLSGTLLLFSALALLMYHQRGSWGYAAFGGLSLVWAVATRYAAGVFLPVLGLLFLVYLWQRFLPQSVAALRQPMMLRDLAAFCLPIAGVGLALLAFNTARYGNPLNTGYLPEESFSAVWWQGIAGQLISPGKGLLLYNPLLLAAFWGIKPAWQRHKPETMVALAVIVIHLLVYGKWFMWHGGFAWGPRFMVATLPFWAIMLAPVFEQKPARLWLGALWIISLILQIPGVAVDFDLWQNRLLETGLPMFDPQTFFNPIYSPLLQTWQLISLPNLDVAWVAQGKIAGGVLALLGLNLAAAAAYFWQTRKSAANRLETATVILFSLITTIVLLRHAHQSQPADLQAAMTMINTLPDIPLVYNNPESAMPIAELYNGRAPVLGVTAQDDTSLAALIDTAESVWWLPAYTADLETGPFSSFGVARNGMFGNQQILLLAQPDGPVQPVNAHFAAGIGLQTAQISRKLTTNAPFAVTFTWQPDQPVAADYLIFIHLLNEAGEIAAQTDGQPVHWTRPTSTWAVNRPVVDPYALWIPPLPPGSYTLIAGLYTPADGVRLPVAATNQTEVGLGTFTVFAP